MLTAPLTVLSNMYPQIVYAHILSHIYENKLSINSLR